MTRIAFFLCFFLNIAVNLSAQTDKIMTYAMVNVPITDMLFVYTEGYGSISTAYDYEDVVDYVLSFGYKPERMAVMFLSSVRSQNVTTKELPQNLTMEYLETRYGKALLNSKGKVLIGVLVPPQVNVVEDKNIKVLSLHDITVKAFQSLPKDSSPKSANQTSLPNQNNEQESVYSMPHRIFDRLVMMNFLALDNNVTKYSAMLEMYDTKQDVYTFMAIPSAVTASLKISQPLNLQQQSSNETENQFDNSN
ncbi:hypothetical protein HAV_01129 [Candidatus Hepatincola sp. Av]